MLTRAQFDRLPELLQKIVVVDRLIVEELRGSVHDFLRLRDLRERRAELRRFAEQRWGHSLRGGPQGIIA